MFTIKKIGTDTEVFIKDKQGTIIPVIGLVGGTKNDPRELDDLGSAVQEDNVMLEFNTIPAVNSEEWVSNINSVLAHIYDELAEKGLTIEIAPSALFTKEALAHRQAQEIGCEPDRCAWTMEENEILSPNKLGLVRTAGGHLHISFSVNDKNPEPNHKINIIRAADLYLGVPSVLLDTDDRRRSFYGKPGAYRDKTPDRVEYRTLSNFWIKNDNLKEWVFNNISGAFKALNTNASSHDGLWGVGWRDRVYDAIVNGNKYAARALINANKIDMP